MWLVPFLIEWDSNLGWATKRHDCSAAIVNFRLVTYIGCQG